MTENITASKNERFVTVFLKTIISFSISVNKFDYIKIRMNALDIL